MKNPRAVLAQRCYPLIALGGLPEKRLYVGHWIRERESMFVVGDGPADPVGEGIFKLDRAEKDN